MRQLVLRIVIPVVWFAAAFTIAAQDTTPEAILAGTVRAQFRADTLTPLIGEPVSLELLADLPPGAVLVTWPEPGEQWGEFAVIEADDLEVTGEVADGQRLRQRLKVIIWEPGDYETPETFVQYRLPGVDETYSAPFTTIFFTAPSVLDSTDLVLRPLKGQIGLFYLSPLMVLLIILAVLTAAGGIWWAYRRWRESRPVVVVTVSATEKAIIALQVLASNGAGAQAVVIQAADILRIYIRERLDIDATELTTSELAPTLAVHERLSDDLRNNMITILEYADAVKFAGQVVAEGDEIRMLRLVQRCVKEVDNALDALWDVAAA